MISESELAVSGTVDEDLLDWVLGEGDLLGGVEARIGVHGEEDLLSFGRTGLRLLLVKVVLLGKVMVLVVKTRSASSWQVWVSFETRISELLES